MLRPAFRHRRPRRWPVLCGPAWELRPPGWLLTVLLGVGLAAACMAGLSLRIYPVLSVAAADQVNNQVNRILNETVGQVLEELDVGYEEIVRLQRDDSGRVTAASSDVAAVNAVRGEVVARMVENIEGMDLNRVDLPLGTLLGWDILSGRGPSLKVQALWVGMVESRVEQQFSDAGINQTLHRVMLSVHIPIQILLPGGTVETEVDSQVCLAESIIVGGVPGTFIQVDQ